MAVYLLHIDPPYKHARHYIGFAKGRYADRRIQQHLRRQAAGTPLIKAALAAGCSVSVVKVWHNGGREFESWLKARRDVGRWCPCCGSGKRRVPRVCDVSERYKATKEDRVNGWKAKEGGGSKVRGPGPAAPGAEDHGGRSGLPPPCL